MTCEENEALMRRYLRFVMAATAGLELPAEAQQQSLVFYSEDMVAHYHSRNRMGGRYVGQDYPAAWAALAPQVVVRLLDVVDVLASADRVSALVRERLEAADGQSLDYERVVLARVTNGQFSELSLYDNTPEQVDGFLEAVLEQ